MAVVKISQGNWIKYCDAVGDYNPLHRCDKGAIAPGMYIASHIQHWGAIRGFERIEFKKKVYDGDSLEMEVLPSRLGKSIDYLFNRGDELVCKVSGVHMGKPDDKSPKPLKELCHKYTAEIDPCKIGHYFSSLRWDPEVGFPNMFLASLSGPALLDFGSSKGIIGLHRRQEFHSHLPYGVGPVDLLVGDEVIKKGSCGEIRDYGLLWSQKGNYIASGSLRVLLGGGEIE